MIKFHIQNFQRFRNLSLTFEPGFGCIIGKSNTGKSSIMRALFLMFRNTYSPSFLRKGEKELSLSLIWDEYSLQCSLSKPLNTYTINGKSYTKASRNPLNTYLPQPHLLPLYGLDLNLQSQFAGLFLLSQTPQNINQFFTQFFGASSWQTALDLVNSDFREISQTLSKNLEPRLSSLTPLLESSLSILQTLSSVVFPDPVPLINDIDSLLDLLSTEICAPDLEPLSEYLSQYQNLLYIHLSLYSTLPSIPELQLPPLQKLLAPPPPLFDAVLPLPQHFETLPYMQDSIIYLSTPFTLPTVPEPPSLPEGVQCPLCGGLIR